MNGDTNGGLDGVKLKKPVNLPIMNGNTDGTVEDSNESYEDPSRALQLLKSSYGARDGISIEEVRVGWYKLALQHRR